MTRRWLSILLVLPLVPACDPGAVGPGPGSGSGDDVALNCEAQLTVTGTIATTTAPDPDLDPGACWPEGTWTINVQVADPADCADVPVATQYVYDVTRQDDGAWVVAYPADPTADLQLTIALESAQCRGTFQHFTPDGKGLILLKAFGDGTEAVTGNGTYDLYP
jgi:hypothetical protein